MSKRPTDAELIDLLKQPHFHHTQSDGEPSNDPIAPTPMVVEVDRIKPYDRNPRRVPNHEYQRIKESIAVSGMDQPLAITRRPDDELFMVAAGGNTRLQAIKELWKETGDERFRRIHCLFRPWAGDTDTLVAHLKENDLRGDLTFIDRALAIRELRQLLEHDSGDSLSYRGLESALKERGYHVSRTLINWFDYAVDILHPAIPLALQSAMGRPQIERIRNLDRAFGQAWETLGLDDGDTAAQLVFADVLSRHDDASLDLDLVRRDLETELSVSADCEVQRASLVLGAALSGREVEDISNGRDDDDTGHVTSEGPSVALPPNDSTSPKAAASNTDISASPTKPPETPNTPGNSQPGTHQGNGPPQPNHHTHASEPPGMPTDLTALRSQCHRLATHIIELLNLGDLIIPIETGLGYLVAPIPEEAVGPSIEEGRQLAAVWWSLVILSEQFARHGEAADHMPSEWKDRPIGEAMHSAAHFWRWQVDHRTPEAVAEVPLIPITDLGPFGFRKFPDQVWDIWVELVSTCRAIGAATDGNPWR